MPVRRPHAAKVLRGTARPDRRPKADAAARLTEAPPPQRLSSHAAEEWRRLAPAAVALGTLTRADARAFELLCETLATEAAAREVIVAEGYTVSTGDGGRKTHPAVRTMETARAQARGLLADFGLTPRGRQGVDATPPQPDPRPDDPWGRLEGLLVVSRGGTARREGQKTLAP